MSKPRLLSLVVGINEFKHVSSLGGCVKDAEEMADYLQEAYKKKLDVVAPQVLINEAATKEGLVSAFEEYLIKEARKGDKVVFHFSGHGAQEKAPTYFLPYEPDGKLEGLVCHDSGEGGTTTLSGKEIRYLIHKLSQKECEILCVFDCCHSGDFRDSLEKDIVTRKVDIGRLSKDFKGREWKDFIFSKEKGWESEEILNQKHLDDLMPQGRHVQMMACLDRELAFEYRLRGQGYFTFALLDTLKKSHGAISYLEIQRRIRHYLRSKKINQTPQVFAPRNYQQDIFKNFIYGDQLEPGIQGNVRFSKHEKNWRLDLGALHGLKVQPGEDPIPVSVDVGEDRPRHALIESVLLNESVISFPEASVEPKRTAPSPRGNYKAQISGLMMEKIQIMVDGERKGVDLFNQEVLPQREVLEQDQIFLTDQQKDASYKVLAKEDHYLITSAFDDRPLIEQIKGYNKASVDEVLNKFRHISQWEFTKNLQSSDTSVFGDSFPLKMGVAVNNQDLVWVHPDDPVFVCDHPEPGEKGAELRLKFENISRQDLFVSCMYLSPLFGVDVDFFEPTMVQLKGHGDLTGVWALNNNAIELELPDYVRDYNWKEELVYLKLIIAEKPFEVNPFFLKELNQPVSREAKGLSRGFRHLADDFEGDKWMTQLFTFRLRNPGYEEVL